MNILVQKFGGTSVANLECMKKVREKVLAGLSKGNKVVVVLSARAGETNHLLALASEWSPEPDKAECDALVSTGEQVSISLFSMLLRDAGIRTRSLLGWQIPIKTDDDFGNARILSIDSAALRRYLEEYDVLVVAGFQGCTEDGDAMPEWLAAGDYEFDVELGTSALLRKCEQFTSLAAISRASGISQQQLSHYANGLREPRQEQRRRIVEGIHRIGKECLAIM